MAEAKARIVITARDDTANALAKARVGFQRLQTQAATVTAAFSGIGAAVGASLSGAALTALFVSTTKGVDALNDLKDATGASIENLSALEDIGARTGTTFDTVGQTLTKFNQVLGNAKAGSEQERILKSIGLSAAELRRQDPAEALRQTAVALSKFADDGNKARIVQELFGKNVRDIAPFLKDLADAGTLNATVTTQQAEEAEKFNKNLFELQKNTKDVARALVSELLPALNKTFESVKKNGGLFNQLLAGASLDPLSIQRKSLENLNLEISRTQSLLDTFTDAQLKEPGNRAYTQRVQELTAELARMRKESAAASEALKANANLLSPLANAGRRPPNEGGGTFNLPSAPDVSRFGGNGRDAKLTAEQIARFQLEAEQEAAKDAAEAWDIFGQIQLDNAKERGDAEKLMWKQVFDFIDSEQEREIEEAQAFLKQAEKLTDEFTLQAARNIQDALGDTISSTLKGDFDNIGDLWRDLLIDMAAEALSAQLGKYLFGDFGKTGNIGGLIGGALGLPQFAVGTPYVPQDMVAVVHKGERIIPAAQNKPGSMGGGITLSMSNVNFGAMGRAEGMAMMRQVVTEAEARLMRRLVRAGAA